MPQKEDAVSHCRPDSVNPTKREGWHNSRALLSEQSTWAAGPPVSGSVAQNGGGVSEQPGNRGETVLAKTVANPIIPIGEIDKAEQDRRRISIERMPTRPDGIGLRRISQLIDTPKMPPAPLTR